MEIKLQGSTGIRSNLTIHIRSIHGSHSPLDRLEALVEAYVLTDLHSIAMHAQVHGTHRF
jgi:hypothetical protein